MPIYEYKCKQCGNEYEELVALNAATPPPCPACKSDDAEKKFSVFGSTGSQSSSCGTSGFS
jgi:putative FmdB family regulatory protein